MWLLMERKSRRSTDTYISGRLWQRTIPRYKKIKRRIGQGWSAFGKLDSIMRDKNIPMRLKRKALNECILPLMIYTAVRPARLATPNWETGHNPEEDGQNHGRSHPEGQKECKLDPEKESCDRHYQEHKRKQTQIGGTHGKGMWQQMDKQSHRMVTPWT